MENYGSRRGLGASLREEERDCRLKIAQTEVEELKQSLRYVELHFTKAKETNTGLTNRLQEVQTALSQVKEDLRQQTHTAHTLGLQVKELQVKLDEAYKENKELNMKAQQRLDEAHVETTKLQEDVHRARDSQLLKTEELAAVTVEREVLAKKCRDLEEELAFKQRELTTLQTRLLDKDKEIEACQQRKPEEDKQPLEIQQLRSDNQRLMRLLKSTSEFNDFVTIEEGNKRFLPLPQDRSRGKSLSTSQKLTSRSEEENWIPAEAYRVAETFRQEQGLALSLAQLNQLLAELNNVWRERERRQVNKIKQETTLEVMNLRRQLALRLPFDVLNEEQQLRKLKAELRKTQQTSALSPTHTDLTPDKHCTDSIHTLLESVTAESVQLKKSLTKALTEFTGDKGKSRAKDALLTRVSVLVDEFKDQVLRTAEPA